MQTFKDLLDATVKGAHPSTVIERAVLPESNQVNEFDSEDEKVARFQEIAGRANASKPYIGPDWIGVIASQIRNASPQGMQELQQMAMRNRDQYAGSARIDNDGSFEMWDQVYKGLVSVATDQIAPQPGV